MENYEVEKTIWTDEDFEIMGWHDSRIHGMATIIDENESWKNEFLFDIDYIFKWVHPILPNNYFSFWVSPCTLSFKNVYDLIIEIDTKGSSFELEIEDINLIEEITNENNGEIYQSWAIELVTGSITFKSQGFKQIVKAKPIFTNGQWLDVNERGGINFNIQPFI